MVIMIVDCSEELGTRACVSAVMNKVASTVSPPQTGNFYNNHEFGRYAVGAEQSIVIIRYCCDALLLRRHNEFGRIGSLKDPHVCLVCIHWGP